MTKHDLKVYLGDLGSNPNCPRKFTSVTLNQSFSAELVVTLSSFKTRWEKSTLSQKYSFAYRSFFECSQTNLHTHKFYKVGYLCLINHPDFLG